MARRCVYFEFVITARSYIRTCSAIDPAWLLQLAPHYIGANDGTWATSEAARSFIVSSPCGLTR